MKKLFLSFILFTGTAAVATAQTPAAKAHGPKYHFSLDTNAVADKSTDWAAYKKQIILNQQKKARLNAKAPAQAKASAPKKDQTVN